MRTLSVILFISVAAHGAEPGARPADPFSLEPTREKIALFKRATEAFIRLPEGPDKDVIGEFLQMSGKDLTASLSPVFYEAPKRQPAEMEMKRQQLEALLSKTPNIPSDHVLLADGRKIPLANVTLLTPVGLRFIGAGIEEVRWENIDPRLAKAYGWSEDVQAEYEAWKKDAVYKGAQSVNAAKKEAQEMEILSLRAAERERQVQAARVPVFVRVSQVVENGALGYGARVERPKYSWEQSFEDWNSGKVEFITDKEHDEPVFVVGLPERVVDGDKWAGWLFPCGKYSYTTVAGGSKTVRKYATTAKVALEELENANR